MMMWKTIYECCDCGHKRICDSPYSEDKLKFHKETSTKCPICNCWVEHKVYYEDFNKEEKEKCFQKMN